MKSMEVKTESRYQSVDALRRDLMGHDNIDNVSMLRKIVMICAPIIGVAAVAICIVLAVQLNRSAPKRRNTTEEFTSVASDTTTENLTKNITGSTTEMKAGSLKDDQSKPALRKAGNVKKFDNTETSSDEGAADVEDNTDYTDAGNADESIGEQSSGVGVKISAIKVNDSEDDLTTDKRVYEQGVTCIYFHWKVISAPPEGTSLRYVGTFTDGESFEDVFYGVTPGFACYVYMAGGDNGIYPGTASLTVYDYTTGELLGEASFWRTVAKLSRNRCLRSWFLLVMSASQSIIRSSMSSPASFKSRLTALSLTSSSAITMGRMCRSTSFCTYFILASIGSFSRLNSGGTILAPI